VDIPDSSATLYAVSLCFFTDNVFHLGNQRIISQSLNFVCPFVIIWNSSASEKCVPFVGYCFIKKLIALSFTEHSVRFCNYEYFTWFDKIFHTSSLLHYGCRITTRQPEPHNYANG
jgi:hypothetical protein